MAESGSCQEAGSGGQWDSLLWGGEIRQEFGAQGKTPPTLAQAMWFHLALARLHRVGLVGQPGLGSHWTSPFLCWDERERVRGRRSGGYQREVIRG